MTKEKVFMRVGINDIFIPVDREIDGNVYVVDKKGNKYPSELFFVEYCDEDENTIEFEK